MSDDEIRNRVWKFLVLKHLKSPNWGLALERIGCRFLNYPDLHEDTPEHIFIRDTALGNIGVPREVAVKILALGFIP